MSEMTMAELCREWNTHARVGLKCETMAGWLKKTEKQRTEQRRVLC